ncbi:hypothetical protein IW262DRAFT_1297684 [Armillaria fumosa]|nr:hypothetical protein IW262DRAFT_1297684 [Armillaria fumosa]
MRAGRVEVLLNINANTITPSFMSKVGGLLKSSGPAFQDVISQCPTLTHLVVGFTPPRETIDEVFSFINRPNMLPALRTLKIAFCKCTISEDGPYIGEWFIKTALSQKHSSLRVFEGSVRTKADEKLLYTSILSATDKVSLEELKAEDARLAGFGKGILSISERATIAPSKAVNTTEKDEMSSLSACPKTRRHKWEKERRHPTFE